MTVGFIGFGGAAYGITKGLKQDGFGEIIFFDPLWDSIPDGDVLKKHAAETGAIHKQDLDQLIREAGTVISCVTGSVAHAVAEQAALFLAPDQLFVDVNSTSPQVMESVGEVIGGRGASFADVAMLGGIPTFLHRVPCVASGDGAERFRKEMTPFGMDITCIGEKPGQASAIKMFRSVFMKGFLALLMEMLSGTHRYQVDSLVLESIAKTMDKNPFLETARLQLGKGVVNAGRMSHEMEAVVETYRDLGLPAVMASAAKEKLEWCNRMNLKDYFGGEIPGSMDEILEIMDKRSK